MNWQTLESFITPAIILTVLAYFVRLFGKAIADQVPYADDRDWQIEVNGLWFFVDFLLPPGIIAVAALLYFRGVIFAFLDAMSAQFDPITYHWVNLVIIFITLLYYAIASSILSEGKYKLTALVPQTVWGGSDLPEKRRKNIFDRIANIDAVILQPTAMVLIFIGGIEVLSGSVLWMTVFAVQIFTALIGLALNYSLMKYHFPRANVHFVSKRSSFSDVILLKVNKDNIRVRDGDRVRVINKDLVSELEIIDANQKPDVIRPMASVTTWIPWLLMVYSFWKHHWIIGLLVGFIAPFILAAIGAWLLKIPQRAKTAWEKAYEDIKNQNDFNLWKYFKSLPWSLKIAIPIWAASIVPDTIGFYGAWHHNMEQAILYGVVTPFIVSLLWQTVIFPQIVDMTKRSKMAETSSDP